MKNFAPAPDNTRALRDALGQFATGVTVVTVMSARGPMGITANSFSSVSLDPALILWCPAKASLRHDALVEADHFALHVMGRDQRDIATGFSREGDAFHLCDWSLGDHEVPLIAQCPVRFECETQQRFDGGDHTIVLAAVSRIALTDAEPLVFQSGLYGAFQPEN